MINAEQELKHQPVLAHPSKPIKYQEYIYSENPYVPFASLYALGIVIDIFSTGKNLCFLKSQNIFEWGIQKRDQIEFSIPQSLNIDETKPPVIILSSQEFISKFVSLCLKDIEQGGLSPQWIIDNLNYIIGYAICHLEWTVRTILSCRQFLSFASVSGRINEPLKSEMESKILENLFFLENMKPIISSSSPFLDEISESQDNSSILKLSLLFHRYDMMGVSTQDIELLKSQLSILVEPIPQDLMTEIDSCIQNLLSESKTANDLQDSLNWFRKSPSKTDSLELEKIGFQKYLEIHKTIDSTLVAQHLKKQLLKVKLGLIPESIRNLLMTLIQDKITDSIKGGIWLLLSLSETRFKIFRNILLVTNRIQSQTRVNSRNLATVILVHSLRQVESTSAESITCLREEMERWNDVWGLLLQDNDFLIQTDEIDSKMLDTWFKVLNQLKLCV